MDVIDRGNTHGLPLQLKVDEFDDVVDEPTQFAGTSLKDRESLPFDQDEILENPVAHHQQPSPSQKRGTYSSAWINHFPSTFFQ
jgi:hypothetical protein